MSAVGAGIGRSEKQRKRLGTRAERQKANVFEERKCSRCAVSLIMIFVGSIQRSRKRLSPLMLLLQIFIDQGGRDPKRCHTKVN